MHGALDMRRSPDPSRAPGCEPSASAKAEPFGGTQSRPSRRLRWPGRCGTLVPVVAARYAVRTAAQRVQELDGEPEDMVFALPKELRLHLIN